MAWNIHFNGQIFGPMSEEESKTIREQVSAVARGESPLRFVEIESVQGGRTLEGLWTIGAPISWEYVREDTTD
jgi:hypothetical protein